MGWKPQGNPGEFSYTTRFLDVGHDPGHCWGGVALNQLTEEGRESGKRWCAADKVR